MPKIARGRGTGASSVTSASGYAVAAGRGPVARGEPVAHAAGRERDHLVAADLAGGRGVAAGGEERGEPHLDG